MITQFRKLFNDESALDDVVMFAATENANSANGSGLKSQIDFLNRLGYDDDRIWQNLFLEHVSEGDRIKIGEPSDEHAEHTTGFVGVVTAIGECTVTVEDSNGKSVDVAFSEVESLSVSEFDAAAWRVKLEEMSNAAYRGCGLSDVLYSRNYTAAVDQAVASLSEEDRQAVISLAQGIGEYYSGDGELDLDDDSCVHGLDRDCCPAGCGEY